MAKNQPPARSKGPEEEPQKPPVETPPPAPEKPSLPPEAKKPLKLDPAKPGQCPVVIPAQKEGSQGSLCPGKLVIEQVPHRGRRCTYCTNFFPDTDQ